MNHPMARAYKRRHCSKQDVAFRSFWVKDPRHPETTWWKRAASIVEHALRTLPIVFIYVHKQIPYTPRAMAFIRLGTFTSHKGQPFRFSVRGYIALSSSAEPAIICASPLP